MDADHTGVEPNRTLLRIRGGSASSLPSVDRTRDTSARATMRPAAAAASDFVERTRDVSGTQEERSERVAPKRNSRKNKAHIGASAVPNVRAAAGHSAKGLAADAGKPDGGVRGGDPEAAALAKGLFAEIGDRFNQNRKKSKATAYEQYQRDLMENMNILVMGGVISLKEITSTITDLEGFMRDNTSEQGKSQAQLLAEWLRLEIEDIVPCSAEPKSDEK